jgi:hypothetical protein
MIEPFFSNIKIVISGAAVTKPCREIVNELSY